MFILILSLKTINNTKDEKYIVFNYNINIYTKKYNQYYSEISLTKSSININIFLISFLVSLLTFILFGVFTN